MKQLLPQFKNQDGITLLLAIMVMSGIAAITVTVAFFVMQEVRAARSSALTEPAIVAAESAGEQGIYQIKRGTFNTTCDTAVYTQIDGRTTTGSVNTRIKKCIVNKPAVIDIKPSDPFETTLYDPNNVQGNKCLEDDAVCPQSGGGTGRQLYSSVVVQHLSGGFDGRLTISTFDGLTYASNVVIPRNGTATVPIDRDILNSTDERLLLTVTSPSGDITVQISTTGVYTGLPDYRTVDAEGCVGLTNITSCETTTSEVFKRRLNITLPR
jgi:type II secretory pathway pseudopilin PulG